MRWEDERYVRLYTRNTVEWEMLPWQSRCTWPLILRAVDRAGLLDLGKHGARGLSALIKLPPEVTEIGLSGLLEDGCLELHGTVLVVPNFVEAQEATQSDAQRKRESRERARALAQIATVTERDSESRNVTASHENGQKVTSCHKLSQAVTSGHSVPCLTDPCLTVPNRSEPERASRAIRVRGTAKHQQDATALLAELSAARRRIDPKARELSPIPANLRHISERLSEGASVDDVRHVIAVCEAECKATPTAFQWFDAVSPFRADNFARKIARDARTTVTATAQSRAAEPVKPPQVPLIDVEAIRREREERLRADNADTRRRFEAGELSEQELRWAIQGGVVSAEEARANGRR